MARNLFALLLVASIVVAGVFADGNTPDSTSGAPSGDDQTWSATTRQFQYEASGNEIKAEGAVVDRDLKTKRGIKFEAKTDQEGLRLYARFFNRAGDTKSMYSDRVITGWGATVKVRVNQMFEYTPSTAGAAFNSNTDNIVNKVAGNWSWKTMTSASTSTYARTLTAQTTDGAFTAVLKFNPPAGNDSISVSSNDLKIDFIVDNSVLKSNGWLNNTNDRIALKGVIQANSNYAQRKNQDSTEVESVAVGAAGADVSAFKWTNFVMCGTRRVTVASSQLMDDSANTANREAEDDDASPRANVVYWSFLDNQAASPTGACIWDPALGVTGSASAVSAFGFLAVLLAAFVALL